MRAQRTANLGILVRIAQVLPLFGGMVLGQPQICVYDADGDGHPLFGHTSVRLGVEFHDGQSFVAESTALDFADFDRDGHLDVVAANPRPNFQYYYLTVLRGHGDGVFDPPTVYLAGNEATDVVAADFNGDQWPDAATANSLGNSISIHLNAGNGTLLPRVEYPAGQQPRSLRLADFDGDGDKDIVCLNCLSNDVSVFLNRGDGSFNPEIRVFVGNVTQLNEESPGPYLALGDLDGDLDIDVAVPARTRVKVLLNSGLGAFTLSPVVLSVPGTSYALVAADFDRDTKQDIAATVLTTSQVAVFRATGNGQFQSAALYDVANRPTPCSGCLYFPGTISAGDLEGDGFPDLAIGHDTWWPFTVVLRNRGDGTFLPKELYQSDMDPKVVKLADVNHDGRDDLSIVNGVIRSYLDVHLTSVAARPMTYDRFPLYDPGIASPSEGRHTMAASDLDNDGDEDLVVGMQAPNFPRSLRVIRNDAGQFVDLPAISLGSAGQVSIEDIAIDDVNGDGRPDIVAADAIVTGGFADPGKVWVLLNQGSMAFAAQPPLLLDAQFPKSVALADLDQDRDLDLAVWTTEVYPGDDITPVSRRVLRFLNSGTGSFTLSGSAVIDHAPWFPRGDVALGDVDADGRLDIVASSGPRNTPGRVVIQRNQGAGAFESPVIIPVAPNAQGLALLPLDSEMGLDIALAHGYGEAPPLNAGAYLTLLYNNGIGSFPMRQEFTNHSYATLGSIAGAPDALPGQPKLVLNHVWGAVQVFLQGKTGLSLTSSFVDTAANFSAGIGIADFNGDQRPDIARVVNGTGNGVVVLFNRSRRLPCYPNCDGIYTQPAALTANDFMCFINAFAVGDPYANCDGSTTPPLLNAADFLCFMNQFAAGCRNRLY